MTFVSLGDGSGPTTQLIALPQVPIDGTLLEVLIREGKLDPNMYED